MTMRTHELHPSLVHAPLVLLPAATLVDGLAVAKPRRRDLERSGRLLWWSAAWSGLAAGLAGMAASREIEVDTEHTRDMMFVHGIANLGIVVSALGIAAWRSRRRAAPTSVAAGLLVSVACGYTAYLGGHLVYAHGAGVIRPRGLVAQAPALFSRDAPGRLARDAVGGLYWLLCRAGRALSGRERVDRTALGPIAEAGLEPAYP